MCVIETFRRSLFGMLCVVISSVLYAKDLGAIGTTYPVAETDFLTFISQKLQHFSETGELAQLQTHWQKTLRAQTLRPRPVAGITTARQAKTWVFDPTFVLHKTLSTPEGKIIARAGSRFNPLSRVRFSARLFFFDGDSQAQRQWLQAKIKALSLKGVAIKAIAVRGNLKALSHDLQQAVYFDQGGRLVRHFSITHVPAIVMQSGQQFKIQEIPLREEALDVKD